MGDGYIRIDKILSDISPVCHIYGNAYGAYLMPEMI